MYLSHYLARGGVCSRRKAATVIKEGHVTVNGSVVTDPSYTVQPKDRVVCANKLVRVEDLVYIALNKPKGVVTTCSDERGRITVLDLIKTKQKERLFPVGRLDKATTGILLITNDGDLAQRLAHPKHKVAKTYIAKLNRPLSHEAFERLKRGVFMKDGKFVPDRVFYPKKTTKRIVGLTIHSGRYRVIRRAFFHMGFEVEELDRRSFGPLTTKGIGKGSWRSLTRSEIEALCGPDKEPGSK